MEAGETKNDATFLQQKSLPSKRTEKAANTSVRKRIVTSPYIKTNVFSSVAKSKSAAFKTKTTTTATVSKITKLILKPKPQCKNPSKIKVTTKKYTANPLATVKSKSTAITQKSSFRIQSIQKSSESHRVSKAVNATLTVNNSIQTQRSRSKENHPVVELSAERTKLNPKNVALLETDKYKVPWEIGQNTTTEKITSLNATKTIENPILHEITTSIANNSNVQPVTALKRPPKTTKSPEKPAKCKSKSYDPIKARQFIRLQKDKRKEKDQEKVKLSASKEEIKRRLTALRKNSLQIVGKNVEKARKKSLVSTGEMTNIQQTVGERSKTDDSKPMVTLENHNNFQTPHPQHTQDIQKSFNTLTQSKLLSSMKSQRDRVGILRRPDGIETPASTFVSHPVPLLRMQSDKSKISPLQTPDLELNLPLPKSDKKRELFNANIAANKKDYNLKMPKSMSLKSAFLNEKQVHVNTHIEANTNTDLTNNMNKTPFWLRPTPVQPYPYNFILAVRKKLESITNPVLISDRVSIQQQQQPQQQLSSLQTIQTPLARPKTEFLSQLRRNLDQQIDESSFKQATTQHSPLQNNSFQPASASKDNSPKTSPSKRSNTQEYSTNFSSVALESRPVDSNLESQFHQNDFKVSQDTLSMSSAILSQSSPEKRRKLTARDRKTITKTNEKQCQNEIRQPSPLSTDHVDGLHIVSRTFSQSEQKSYESESNITSFINFRRGNDFNTSNQPSLVQEDESVSVHKLLSDFNESLSQVIKVNQHLHRVLSNPSTNRMTEAPTNVSSQLSKVEYIDDFENQSESKNTHLDEFTYLDTNTVPSYKSQYTPIASDDMKTNSQNAINGLISEENRREHRSSTMVDDAISAAHDSAPLHENTSSTIQTMDDYDKDDYIMLNETSIRSSTRNGADIEKVLNELESAIESGSHPNKQSTISTEKPSAYTHTSESPTNNELKSFSLSIAKKSTATDDETEQKFHLDQSFQKYITGDTDVLNQSIGSDIFAIFNQTAVDMANDFNSTAWSEQNVSYSSLGKCDQLIQSELRKSEDLASLLKFREKSLIDRFKGQIAWLELQKKKFKENGLTVEISMVKKKQRALLLRLNRDRKELYRIFKQQQENATKNSPSMNYNVSHLSTNMSIRRTSASAQQQLECTPPKQAMKAIELPGGGSTLEMMLQKREAELRRRREHVEKLLNWHQRLDHEEREVIKMEQMIMLISTTDTYQTTSHEQINDTLAITVHHHSSKRSKCQQQQIHCQHHGEVSTHEQSLTNITATSTTTATAREQSQIDHKKQKQIQKIEKSLNALKMISAQSISSDIDGSNARLVEDVVDIFGRQLNKLWKRLTGKCEEKFTSDKMYKLSKFNLESLYEEAKMVVLQQFHTNDEFKRRLINDSLSVINDAQSKNEIEVEPVSASAYEKKEKSLTEELEAIVPVLNLNSSPEPSAVTPPKEIEISDSDQGYYFSSNNDQSSDNQQLTVESIEKHDANNDKVTSDDANIQKISQSPSTLVQSNVKELQEDDQSSVNETTHSVGHESEDVQSDITEDSLNKSKPTAENTSQSEIQNVLVTNDFFAAGFITGTEPTESSEIQTATESNQTNSSIEFNLSNGSNSQLIENTSFPHIDVTTVIVPEIDEIQSDVSTSTASTEKNSIETKSQLISASDDKKYQSDDFDDVKSTEKSTSNITVTSKVTDATEQEPSTKSSGSPTKTNNFTSKELEQCLINIDDSLKEINETFAHSPALHNTSSDSGSSITIDGSHIVEEIELESKSEHNEDKNKNSVSSASNAEENDNKLESENDELKSLIASTQNVPSVSTTEPVILNPIERNENIVTEFDASKVDNNESNAESTSQKRANNFLREYGLSTSVDYNKVPEADALKRSQIPLEPEVTKAIDQTATVAFPFLREIPNKPPPPYPTHRQIPKTPVFPSDDRIKEIIFQRIEYLYETSTNTVHLEQTPAADATFIKSPSTPNISYLAVSSPVVNENNIFERLILDVCDEIMHEFDPHGKQTIGVYRQPLAFYKPPNRLLCIQEHALKRVFKLLSRNGGTVAAPTTAATKNAFADAKPFQQVNIRSCLPSQVAQLTFNNRRKRDAVDEVLIQELYEDEWRWTNFDLEEEEIRNSVSDLRTLLLTDDASIQDESTNTTDVLGRQEKVEDECLDRENE